MRFLVGGIFALLAAWGGYWYVGQRAIEGQIAAFLAQSPGGLIIEQSGYDVAGFPSRFDLTVTAPRVTDSATGWGWSAEFAQVFAMTWKPWHLIAALPHSQTVETPFGAAQLDSSRFMASVRVAPDRAAGIEEVVVQVDAPVLSAPMLPKISAETVVIALKHEVTQGFAYRFGVQIAQLTPLVAAPKGGNLTAARLDVVLHTAAALDRTAAISLPEVTQIDLEALSLQWGTVSVVGDGRVMQAVDGHAEGEIALKVQDWRGLPDALADFGLLRRDIAPTVLRALELIAKQKGNPEVLDLPLIFRSGRMYLGPLPLGAAPMLGQRQ